jgi:acid phosphatase (class A)
MQARRFRPLLTCALSLSCLVLAPWSPAQGESKATGYLDVEERPDSLLIVPPPPREGTTAHAADVEAHRAMRALRGTPRWRLASADANVKFPGAASTFSCASGLTISKTDTPHVYHLLQRSLIDAGQSTARAKNAYARARPSTVYDEPICVPGDAAALRKSGSYPSGHAAAGWAWALILAELVPERSGPILRRGYEFGLSRAVCGVHWISDIDTGRTVGAAAVARLHADPEFRVQLEQARAEIARARGASRGGQPASCQAESAALAATASR